VVRAEPAIPLEQPRVRRSARTRTVAVIGPVTVLAGVVWTIFQPYRLTLLHPEGQGFWWLAVEPPLLIVLVGLLFSAFVAPGLIEDLEDDR
jgi:hypothetical protein